MANRQPSSQLAEHLTFVDNFKGWLFAVWHFLGYEEGQNADFHGALLPFFSERCRSLVLLETDARVKSGQSQ